LGIGYIILNNSVMKGIEFVRLTKRVIENPDWKKN
jgi:hypothetical protein